MIRRGDGGFAAIETAWLAAGSAGFVKSGAVWYRVVQDQGDVAFLAIVKKVEKSTVGTEMAGKYGIYAPDFTPPAWVAQIPLDEWEEE